MIRTVFPMLVLLLTISAACGEAVIDPIETDSGVFSFYGTIEVGNSPNIVRVKDLNEAFLADSTEFNGTVTFHDLDEGTITTLRDTVIKFSAGYTHNFFIPNKIKHSSNYLLKAEHNNGRYGQTSITTPARTGVNLSPDGEGVGGGERITFTFQNVAADEIIDLRVSVQYNNETREADMRFFLREFIVAEDEEATRISMSPENFLVEVFPPEEILNNPTLDPFSVDPTVSCAQLSSNRMEIIFTHFGSEWSIAKPFTRGLINTESGVVENGLGLFGGFYRNSIELTIGEDED